MRANSWPLVQVKNRVTASSSTPKNPSTKKNGQGCNSSARNGAYGLIVRSGSTVTAEVIAAAKAAHVDAFVRTLPAGYNDLGSGMRHQVTREFSAYAPHVLGICVSQDSHVSLYRQGKLVSRLY